MESKTRQELSDNGVRHCCVWSSFLFNLYSGIWIIFESVLREIMDGIMINGHNVNNLRYVDDTVIRVDYQAALQHLRITTEGERFDLKDNMD